MVWFILTPVIVVIIGVISLCRIADKQTPPLLKSGVGERY